MFSKHRSQEDVWEEEKESERGEPDDSRVKEIGGTTVSGALDDPVPVVAWGDGGGRVRSYGSIFGSPFVTEVGRDPPPLPPSHEGRETLYRSVRKSGNRWFE